MLIAVTCDRRAEGPTHATPGRVRPARPEVYVGEAVIAASRRVGLEPVLLPPGLAEDALDDVLLAVRGVVITGGAFDIHPRHYGQQVTGRLDRTDEDRTDLELSLARRCLDRDVPVLGLCGGMQALVVAAGGTLLQDIAQDVPGALDHEQPTDPATPWHTVQCEGLLARALGRRIQVNSTHHQAAADPGALTVCGRAPDGVIEAVLMPGHRFALGVQWHPELIDDRVFQWSSEAL